MCVMLHVWRSESSSGLPSGWGRRSLTFAAHLPVRVFSLQRLATASSFYMGSRDWRPFLSFLGPVSTLSLEPSLWVQKLLVFNSSIETLISEPFMALSCLCLESSQVYPFSAVHLASHHGHVESCPSLLILSSFIRFCIKYTHEHVHKELNIHGV